MSKTTERLERLKKQEAQLKARIEQEQARISASARKERDGKLIAWGVAVEQLIADETFKAEWWKLECQRVLTGRTLERALVQELASVAEGLEPQLTL
jgi:hypothetical protein